MRNLELVLEELQVFPGGWGRGQCPCKLPRAGGPSSWFWLCMRLSPPGCNEWSSLLRDPWAPEQAVSRWAGREGYNCRAGWGTGQLCWSKSALAASTWSPQGVPVPLTSCSQTEWSSSFTSAPITWLWIHVPHSWLKLQVEQALQWPCVCLCLPML